MAAATPRHATDAAGVAFQHAPAAARLHLPQPHGSVIGRGERALAVGTPRNALDAAGVAERDDVHNESFACQSLLIGGSPRQWAAGVQELGVFLLAKCRPPVQVQELRQRAPDRRVVEPQRDEPALLVQRVAKPERASLQLCPVRPERLRRHAEHQHARVLQALLDPGRDAVAGLDLPLIEPHVQPVGPQPLRQWSHHRLVSTAVAQEDIEAEVPIHALHLHRRRGTASLSGCCGPLACCTLGSLFGGVSSTRVRPGSASSGWQTARYGRTSRVADTVTGPSRPESTNASVWRHSRHEVKVVRPVGLAPSP